MTNYCKCGCGTEIAEDKTWCIGHHRRGTKHSDESKTKNSASKMGHEVSVETRTKIGDGHRGKSVSEESKALMSASKRNRSKIAIAETGAKISASLRNSEAHKLANEKMRDKNDTIDHHYIYDHSNLNKYTTKMTRSKHAFIHMCMRRSGIKVPHINREARMIQ